MTIQEINERNGTIAIDTEDLLMIIASNLSDMQGRLSTNTMVETIERMDLLKALIFDMKKMESTKNL